MLTITMVKAPLKSAIFTECLEDSERDAYILCRDMDESTVFHWVNLDAS